MSRFHKTISVVANPWFAIDHKGRPCGVVPVEPREVGGHLGFVGAKVDRSRTTGSIQRPGEILPSAQDTVYEFSRAPVKVAATAYYRDILRSGALLPADTATAKWAGIRFVEPAKALEQAKAAAEAEFDRNYGAGALADLREQTGVSCQAVAPAATSAPSAPAGEAGASSTDTAAAQPTTSKQRGKASNSQKDGE